MMAGEITKTEILETKKGGLSICHLDDSEIIQNTADFMDLIIQMPQADNFMPKLQVR